MRATKKFSNVSDQFDITVPCSAAYFLEVGARVSLKVATKTFLTVKKTVNIQLYSLFLCSKDGGVPPKSLRCFLSIWHYCSLFSYIFCGTRCSRFIENSHQTVSQRQKNCEKLAFQVAFIEQKHRRAIKKFSNISDQFGITIASSATYFQEQDARFSLKVASKGFLRGKKTLKIQRARLFP